MSARRVARPMRRALSILELLGCLIAVAGGVVLGSIYLGVDVQQAAVGLLQRAQTVSAPTTTPSADMAGAVAGAQVSSAGTTTATPTPLAPSPAVVPAAPAPAPAPPVVVAEPLLDAMTVTPEQREALTRDYWQAINACIDAEATARRSAVNASGEWELYDYLSRRGAGHQSAADCIARLNLRGVDDHVAAYAEQVQDWHEAGATLFARAKDLLTDAPTAQLSGPFAHSWQSAATQHQMEERLLKEKHQAVEAYLEHADTGETAAAAPQE